MSQRFVWIIRHAKTEPGARGQSDFDRALTDRGHRDGALMQAYYASHAVPAGWLWASEAVRAQQTADYIAAGFAAATRIDTPELYLADPETVIGQLRATPDSVACVAVVAHNPGLSYAVSMLAPAADLTSLPTLGSVLLDCGELAAWSDLQPGIATLADSMTPKLLRV